MPKAAISRIGWTPRARKIAGTDAVTVVTVYFLDKVILPSITFNLDAWVTTAPTTAVVVGTGVPGVILVMTAKATAGVTTVTMVTGGVLSSMVLFLVCSVTVLAGVPIGETGNGAVIMVGLRPLIATETIAADRAAGGMPCGDIGFLSSGVSSAGSGLCLLGSVLDLQLLSDLLSRSGLSSLYNLTLRSILARFPLGLGVFLAGGCTASGPTGGAPVPPVPFATPLILTGGGRFVPLPDVSKVYVSTARADALKGPPAALSTSYGRDGRDGLPGGPGAPSVPLGVTEPVGPVVPGEAVSFGTF